MVHDPSTRTQQQHVSPGEEDEHGTDNPTETEEGDRRHVRREVYIRSRFPARRDEGYPPHNDEGDDDYGIADRVPDYHRHCLATRSSGFRVRIPV